MRIADRLLLKGVKVYDIRLWKSSQTEPLKRFGRQAHYPPRALDCLDPYLLLAHQGFVEDLLLRDVMERGVDIERNITFVDYMRGSGPEHNLEVVCKASSPEAKQAFATSYLVGCDGAHSNVRKVMGANMLGTSYDRIWAVIDGELETDFPDIHSKTVIYNDEAGSVIILPRERGMTRLCIELKADIREAASKEELSRDSIMSIAREIFKVCPIHRYLVSP
jgi:2-polyprenyl-6-methoxyphenol hydroxylase-like FAD-dependent oxidoreductase